MCCDAIAASRGATPASFTLQIIQSEGFNPTTVDNHSVAGGRHGGSGPATTLPDHREGGVKESNVHRLDGLKLTRLIDWDSLMGGAKADGRSWENGPLGLVESRAALGGAPRTPATPWSGWLGLVPDEVQKQVLALAVELLGPGAAFVTVLRGDRLVVKCSTAGGPQSGASVPTEGTLLGRAATTGLAVFSDGSRDVGVEIAEIGLFGDSLACAPIKWNTGEVLGVLGVATPEPVVPTPEAEAKLGAVVRFLKAQIEIRLSMVRAVSRCESGPRCPGCRGTETCCRRRPRSPT